MATVVFTSPVAVGNQSLITNGHYTSYTMTKESGSFPSSGYRITSATLSCTLRNAQWDTVTAKSGSVTLGSFEVGGTSGDRTCSLSTSYDWPNFTAMTLYGGGVGTQIAGGSYVKVTVTWEYTTSGLTLSAGSITAGSALTAYIAYHDASFTHRLTLFFGSTSWSWSVSAGVTGYAFTVPMETLNQIPNASGGSGAVYLYTLSGGSVIGSASASLTITAPSSAAPTFTAACAPL